MKNSKLIVDLFVTHHDTDVSLYPPDRWSSYRNNSVNLKNGLTVPLAMMVPDGHHAGAVKRKGTAIEWANRSGGWVPGGTKSIPGIANTYKNDPVNGFEFVGSVERYTTANKWLRVFDPRGYVLEISVENAVFLMENSTIIKGVVQENCVWGRLGATNTLVPEGSELYNDMKANKPAY